MRKKSFLTSVEVTVNDYDYDCDCDDQSNHWLLMRRSVKGKRKIFNTAGCIDGATVRLALLHSNCNINRCSGARQ